MRRNLPVTVQMLRVGGLLAYAAIAGDLIEVRLDGHCATFPASAGHRAADWLAQCAVKYHPESDFSKLWMMLATAAGGVIPFNSR